MLPNLVNGEALLVRASPFTKNIDTRFLVEPFSKLLLDLCTLHLYTFFQKGASRLLFVALSEERPLDEYFCFLL